MFPLSCRCERGGGGASGGGGLRTLPTVRGTIRNTPGEGTHGRAQQDTTGESEECIIKRCQKRIVILLRCVRLVSKSSLIIERCQATLKKSLFPV